MRARGSSPTRHWRIKGRVRFNSSVGLEVKENAMSTVCERWCLCGPAKSFVKLGRRLRGSTLSRRSRSHVSEGTLPTPNSDLKFRAGTKLSSKRICTPSFSSDVIFKLNTATPVIRQSDRVIPRETTGSGTLSKHSRHRQMFAERILFHFAARFCFAQRITGPAQKSITNGAFCKTLQG